MLKCGENLIIENLQYQCLNRINTVSQNMLSKLPPLNINKCSFQQHGDLSYHEWY